MPNSATIRTDVLAQPQRDNWTDHWACGAKIPCLSFWVCASLPTRACDAPGVLVQLQMPSMHPTETQAIAMAQRRFEPPSTDSALVLISEYIFEFLRLKCTVLCGVIVQRDGSHERRSCLDTAQVKRKKKFCNFVICVCVMMVCVLSCLVVVWLWYGCVCFWGCLGVLGGFLLSPWAMQGCRATCGVTTGVLEGCCGGAF